MCNPQSSSQFLVEENKLFNKVWDQKKYDWNEKDNYKILEIMEVHEFKHNCYNKINNLTQ